MQFQTLLPAILFAQSTFAYTCCFEIRGTGNYALFHSNMPNGGIQVWRPWGSNECEMMVNKSGATCKDWKYSIAQNSCNHLKPFKHIGTTGEATCKYTGGGN
ncbi:hypothetical protein Vi05172_g7214 [Venturia inaequalis]|nr:hypothetical protein Vi05172_g7214 [Venturia inaequalis]